MIYLTIENPDYISAKVEGAPDSHIHNIAEYISYMGAVMLVDSDPQVYASSSIDFPEEETGNEDVIQLAQYIRGNG